MDFYGFYYVLLSVTMYTDRIKNCNTQHRHTLQQYTPQHIETHSTTSHRHALDIDTTVHTR